MIARTAWRPLPMMMAMALAACGDTPDNEADPAPTAEEVTEQTKAAFADGFATTADPADEATAEHPPGLPYRSRGSVTRRVEQAFAREHAKNVTLPFLIADPADFLRSGRAMALAERALKARGYPEDDLSGAIALMMAVSWEIANGRTLDAADHQAILRQVNQKMRGNPLERQGDEERQFGAVLRLLTTALWLEEAHLRETLPDRKQELSDSVQRDMAKISNNDMRALVVTSEGMVDR